MLTSQERETLAQLEDRIRILLPDLYQETYEAIEPLSMGSAGLKYDDSGKVAWNEIWGSFCDLAMAGGPPHKGLLLQPAPRADIDAQPDRYREVVDEICRGVAMVTERPTGRSPHAGWIQMTCDSPWMAEWLLRAIVMENVSAAVDGASLDLPAGPEYRLHKEIKNVVTVIAKTCHYWTGHIWRPQQHDIADLFDEMSQESPLVAPPQLDDVSASEQRQPARRQLSESIAKGTGLAASPHHYSNWLGLESGSVRAAIWMMRMLVAVNVLARREGTVLFVPINLAVDPRGDIVAEAVRRVHRFALAGGHT